MRELLLSAVVHKTQSLQVKMERTRAQRLRSGASCSGLQSEGELSLLAQLGR